MQRMKGSILGKNLADSSKRSSIKREINGYLLSKMTQTHRKWGRIFNSCEYRSYGEVDSCLFVFVVASFLVNRAGKRSYSMTS
jgi:hypothetical protein